MDFFAIQPHGGQFTVIAQLLQLTEFFHHPVGNQLAAFAVVYGERHSVSKAGRGSKAKKETYSLRLTVSLCHIWEPSLAQCARTVAAVVWGSEGALSLQIQHQLLATYLSEALSLSNQRRCVLWTSKVASVGRGEAPIRMAMSVLYLIGHGRSTDDHPAIFSELFADKKIITLQGITMAVFKTPADALRRNPTCKSLASQKIVLISGLELLPPVTDVLGVLCATRAIVVKGPTNALTLLNLSVRGVEMRYLVLLGEIELGQINLSDPTFKGISTAGQMSYNIRVQFAELLGQAELRQAFQSKGKPSSGSVPSTSPSSALAKRKTTPTAWDGTMERYSTDSALTTSGVNKLLNQHSEEIRSIKQSIGGLYEKVDQQGIALTNMVTLSQIQEMMKALLESKAKEN